MTDLFGLYDTAGRHSFVRNAAWWQLTASADAGFWVQLTGQGGWRAATAGDRAGLAVTARPDATRGPREGSRAVSADGRLTVAAIGRDAGASTQGMANTLAAADLASDPQDLTALLSPQAASLCAVHDRVAQVLTVIRGPGAPPVYRFASADTVWIGTRLSALRGLPDFPTALDEDALAFFLAFGFAPLGRTFFRGVDRLEAGGSLRITPEGVEEADETGVRPPPGLEPAPDRLRVTEPLDVLGEAVLVAISAVADRRVAILGAADDPRSAWLADLARQAGAAAVLPLPAVVEPLPFTEAIETVRRVTAAEGEIFAAPAFVTLSGWARAVAGQADIGLCADGSTTLPVRLGRHRRFAQKVAQAGETRQFSGRRQDFDAGAAFLRDLYFDELALFDDTAHLALAGPRLAQANVFAMADALGPTLESATPEMAADLASDLDGMLVTAGIIAPLAGAVGREADLSILAPFADPTVRARIRALPASGREELGKALEAWPQEEPAITFATDRVVALDERPVRAMLSSPIFLQRGLFGRRAVSELLERHFDGSVPSAGRLWALCCLEVWFQELVDGRS